MRRKPVQYVFRVPTFKLFRFLRKALETDDIYIRDILHTNDNSFTVLLELSKDDRFAINQLYDFLEVYNETPISES